MPRFFWVRNLAELLGTLHGLHCACCLCLLYSLDASSCHVKGSPWVTLALQFFYFYFYRSWSPALRAALQLPCLFLQVYLLLLLIKTLYPFFPRAPFSSHIPVYSLSLPNGATMFVPLDFLACPDCGWPHQKRYFREMVGQQLRIKGWRRLRQAKGKGRGREEWGKVGIEETWG